jgi:hypothetical protein
MSIIHVNSNTIRTNRKQETDFPPLSVRKTRSGKATYCNEVEICDEFGTVVARFVYSPSTPLSCGAQVWIETTHQARIINNVEEIPEENGEENEQ